MGNKNIKWFKVAGNEKEIPWQPNNLAIAEAGGKKITIARIGEELFACAYQCPHASGVLAGGFIDTKGNIVCPSHHYRFNIRNGHNVSGEGYSLKTFIIEQREAGIFIGLEESI